MKWQLRTEVVDVRQVPQEPDQAVIDWLGDALKSWDSNGLIVHNDDGWSGHARVGWYLIRWPDGELTVCSTQSARRTYEPVPE